MLFGALEITLAFNKPLRDMILENSLWRAKRGEAAMLFVAGISGLSFGAAMIFFY